LRRMFRIWIRSAFRIRSVFAICRWHDSGFWNYDNQQLSNILDSKRYVLDSKRLTRLDARIWMWHSMC
jgi:hypothetical protein